MENQQQKKSNTTHYNTQKYESSSFYYYNNNGSTNTTNTHENSNEDKNDVELNNDNKDINEKQDDDNSSTQSGSDKSAEYVNRSEISVRIPTPQYLPSPSSLPISPPSAHLPFRLSFGNTPQLSPITPATPGESNPQKGEDPFNFDSSKESNQQEPSVQYYTNPSSDNSNKESTESLPNASIERREENEYNANDTQQTITSREVSNYQQKEETRSRREQQQQYFQQQQQQQQQQYRSNNGFSYKVNNQYSTRQNSKENHTLDSSTEFNTNSKKRSIQELENSPIESESKDQNETNQQLNQPKQKQSNQEQYQQQQQQQGDQTQQVAKSEENTSSPPEKRQRTSSTPEPSSSASSSSKEMSLTEAAERTASQLLSQVSLPSGAGSGSSTSNFSVTQHRISPVPSGSPVATSSSRRKDRDKHVPRPMNAFLLFSNETRPLLARENPNASNCEISKMLGEKWRSMKSDEKKKYQEEAKEIRKKFNEQHPDYEYGSKTSKLLRELKKAAHRGDLSPSLSNLASTLSTIQQHMNVDNSGKRVRRPMNAFILFSNEERKRLAEENPTLPNKDISKLLGDRWKSMSKEDKKPYQERAKQIREEFNQKHPDYQYSNTPKALRQFLKNNYEAVAELLPGGTASIERLEEGLESMQDEEGLWSQIMKYIDEVVASNQITEEEGKELRRLAREKHEQLRMVFSACFGKEVSCFVRDAREMLEDLRSDHVAAVALHEFSQQPTVTNTANESGNGSHGVEGMASTSGGMTPTSLSQSPLSRELPSSASVTAQAPTSTDTHINVLPPSYSSPSSHQYASFHPISQPFPSQQSQQYQQYQPSQSEPQQQPQQQQLQPQQQQITRNGNDYSSPMLMSSPPTSTQDSAQYFKQQTQQQYQQQSNSQTQTPPRVPSYSSPYKSNNQQY